MYYTYAATPSRDINLYIQVQAKQLVLEQVQAEATYMVRRKELDRQPPRFPRSPCQLHPTINFLTN